MFSNYPKLVDIIGAVPAPAVFQLKPMPELKGLTVEGTEEFNRAFEAYHHDLVKDFPVPDVREESFTYRNGDYVGKGTVYRPKSDDVLPILVYIHGGAYTILTAECYDYECASFAEKGNCVVFNVDYRPALDGVKVPDCFEDCYAAFLAIAEQAADYGADAGRIAVMGDSAGASIAVGLSILTRERKGPAIARQILCYMGVGFDLNEIENGNDSELGTANILKIGFNDPQDSQVPHINPLFDEHKELIPPTTFIDGDCDMIIDDTMQYAKALTDAGVDVEMRLYAGMIHGFINLPFEQSLDAHDFVGKVLHRTFDR